MLTVTFFLSCCLMVRGTLGFTNSRLISFNYSRGLAKNLSRR